MTSAGLQSQTRGQWARLLRDLRTDPAGVHRLRGDHPAHPVAGDRPRRYPGSRRIRHGHSGYRQAGLDLPAGVIAPAGRERLSIALACLVDAAIMVVRPYLAGSVPVLALAVFIHGTTGSIFGLARQTYITDAIPPKYRARGMSSSGGVLRIGYFIGPLAVSALISGGEIRNAFIFAACMSLVAGVTMMLPALRRPIGPRG